MKRCIAASLTVASLFFANIALADSPIDQPTAGNAAEGKKKTELCTACHAADGNSTISINPKLAGQVPGYINNQLKAFKDGSRVNATMAPMVAALSEQDMLDIDAYYSAQTQTPGEITKDLTESALRGEAVYRKGVSEYKIAACMACHGPSGKGIAPNYPRISGQHKDYLKSQLLAFKSSSRHNDMMNPTAFALSEQQIDDLANYLQSLY